MLARRDEQIAHAERRVFLPLGHVAEQLHALGDAELVRGALNLCGVRPVADDQQIQVAMFRGCQHLHELGRGLAGDEPADSRHHERGIRNAKRCAVTPHASGRARDAQRNELHRPLHTVDPGDVGCGVA